MMRRARVALACCVLVSAVMLPACGEDEAPLVAGTPEVAAAIKKLQEGKPEDREAAIAVLAKAEDPAVVPPLVQAARLDNQRHLRLAALRALRRPALVKDASPLIELLDDREAQVRAVACETLAPFKLAAAETKLAALLGDAQAIVRVAAIQALSQLGPSGLDRLAPVLDSADVEDQVAVIRTFGAAGDKSRVGPLIMKLGNDHDVVRRAAAEALGQIGEPVAVEPLAKLIKDPLGEESKKTFAARLTGPMTAADRYAMVRELDDQLVAQGQAAKGAAAHGWLMSGDGTNHRNLLARVVERQRRDAEMSIRLTAFEALKRIKDPAAARVAGEFLASEDAGIGTAAARSFAAGNGESALINIVRDKSKPLIARQRALQMLLRDARTPDAAIQNDAILKAFQGQTEDTVIRVGPGSGDVLRILPLSDAMRATLIELLTEPDVQMRFRAASELAVRQAPEALEPLLALLKENPPGLRDGIVKALGNYNDARMTEPLLAVLKTESDSRGRDAIINALGAARNKQAVPALLTLATSDNHPNQPAAVRALGQIADPSAGAPLFNVYRVVSTRIDEETSANANNRGRDSNLNRLNHLRRLLVEAIGMCGHREAGDTFMTLAQKYPRSDTEEYAFVALGRLRHTQAFDPIATRLLKGPYRGKAERNANYTALACTEALVLLNDPRAAAVFEQIVRNPPDGPTLDLAANGLGRLKHQQSIDALLTLLVDPAIERAIKETNIAPALAAHGTAAQTKLATLLVQAPEPAGGTGFDAGVYAAQLLAALGPDALPVFEQAAASDKLYVLARVVDGVGRIADERAVALLGKLAKHKDPRVRQWSVVALGKSRQPAAVPLLKASVADDDKDVARWARWGVEQHGVKQ